MIKLVNLLREFDYGEGALSLAYDARRLEEFTNGYEFTMKHINDNEYAIIATRSGKQIGRLDFIKSKFKPVLKATIANVDPSYRRRGIATSMYQFAEQEFNLKFVRNDDVLTADGKSLWNSKNRKFGR